MQLSIHSIEGIAFNGALNTDVVSFYSGLDTLELDSQDHSAISVTESNHILSCMHCLHLNHADYCMVIVFNNCPDFGLFVPMDDFCYLLLFNQ